MRGFHPRKHKTQNLAAGGVVSGPGTGTSDDVPAVVREGSYVLPADSAQALGFKPRSRNQDDPARGFKPRMRQVNLSNGEIVLSPQQVQAAGGRQVLEGFRAATHTPVPEKAIPVESRLHYFANGGLVGDENKRPNSFGDMAAATTDRNVTVVDGYSPPRAAVTPQAASGQGASTATTPDNSISAAGPSAGAGRGFVNPPAVRDLNFGQPPAATSQAARLMPAEPGTPAAMASAQNPASQPQALGFAPGVYQHGRGQYSDNPDGMGFKPGFTGKPTAQNDAAAQVLADSSMRGFRPAGVEPIAPAASQNLTPADTGQGYGFGLLNSNRIAARNAAMDVQQLKPGSGKVLANILQQQEDAPKFAMERDRMAQAERESAATRSMRQEELRSDRSFRAGQLANETARVALESTSPERQGQSVVQAMRSRIAQEQDPAKRQGLVQHMRDMEGKTAPTTTPPAGYRWTANGQGLEAIPGGPAAITQAEDRRTRDSAHEQTRQTIGTINRLMEHPGRMGATGTWNLGRMVPGSDASDFAAEVETLKAQTFLPMVQQLRGMGALSNAEGEKLNAAVGALRFDMSEKAFNESLGRIRDQFGSALGRAGIDTKDMQSWGLPSQSEQPQGGQAAQKRAVRTGTFNGRRVVQYADGSVSYAD